MSDDNTIDYSDIPELDEQFWTKARLVKKANKKLISIRLDEDIVDYFKENGTHYQTDINNVLRHYVSSCQAD